MRKENVSHIDMNKGKFAIWNSAHGNPQRRCTKKSKAFFPSRSENRTRVNFAGGNLVFHSRNISARPQVFVVRFCFQPFKSTEC